MKYYRHPKTRQEKSKNDKYTRAKRRSVPDASDDIKVNHEKSWKSIRKTQYKDNDGKFKKRFYKIKPWCNYNSHFMKWVRQFDHAILNGGVIYYGPKYQRNN